MRGEDERTFASEKLSRGYSYIQDEKGKNVRSISQAGQDSVLTMFVADGKIRAKVDSTEKLEYPGKQEEEKRFGRK